MLGYKTTQLLKALGWFCFAGILYAVLLLAGVLEPVLQVPFRWFTDYLIGMFEGFVDTPPATETG